MAFFGPKLRPWLSPSGEIPPEMDAMATSHPWLQVQLPPSKGSKGAATRGELPLSGFDALKSDVPAAVLAAEEPQNRLLRPPHRTHMPNELPEDETMAEG